MGYWYIFDDLNIFDAARPVHNGKVRGQTWTIQILKLEVRWVLNKWGKTEANRCFFTELKSVEIWLRYKHFCVSPNSKIIAKMLKVLAAQVSHSAVSSTRRVRRFSVFANIIWVIRSHLRYRSAKSSGYFS